MLTLHSITSPRDQEELFGSFNPGKATWLVSDLKTKLDLHRRLLATREFLPGDAVLRASELWRLMLSRLRPDLQLVSKEFAVTLIGHKLSAKHEDFAWAQAPGSAQTAMNYMTQFMPILAHPEGEAIMKDWLKAHPASQARWGRWFELSLELWAEFLAEGFIAPHWASGVLVNETDLNTAWLKPLYVNLGAELNQVEADLLIQLSEGLDIHVVVPNPAWVKEYPKTLAPYEFFERKLKVAKVTAPEAPTTPVGEKSYRKYTTMIAEVKDAVAEARQWLSSSRPAEIAIVAPDIEVYWPALSSYLEQEGIPCQKETVRRLHSYLDISRFMAHLRLRTGSFAEADLELAIFPSGAASGEGGALISHDRFKTLYGTLYGREDVARAQNVAMRFAVELSASDEVLRDDFVAWSLRQLPEDTELNRVESLYKRLFSEVPEGLRLSVQRWLAYLEQLASRVECRVRDGESDGIACINLTSMDSSPATKMIVLGLTESALKPGGGTAVLYSDILSLEQQFGFHLASVDQARAEFDARWATDDARRTLILCVPETDFNGAAQAPSWLWVRGSREAGDQREKGESLSVPEPTRWDELQKAELKEIAKERNWSGAQRSLLERTFREDLGQQPYEAFGEGLITAVSPSGIEDYLNCPFIFAAKRLLGLSDVAELDLEVDPSRRGSLMHKLFELLTVEPMRFDLSEEEFAEVVERARELSRLELADMRLWQPLKRRHIDLAKRFLEFERESRTQFPHAQVLGREVDIAGYIRPSTGELIAEPEPGAIKFVGRIDRVDTDEMGNLAIYDYKSSGNSTTQFGSWCGNNKIQLLLYAIAVEKGLTEFLPRPVQSAMYYVARPLSRDAGFKVEGVEQGLYDTEDRRRRNRLSPEEKERLFSEGEGMVKKALDGIAAGRFDPNPRDKKDCPTCLWSAVCRAPHLNS